MTLPCPHCGTCDTPVLSPGTGPHALRASCRHCGRFIKWLPKALVQGSSWFPLHICEVKPTVSEEVQFDQQVCRGEAKHTLHTCETPR
jgi:hypothetical protein